MSNTKDDKLDDIQIDEAARRKGDAALLRALKTPPKPHKPSGKRTKSQTPQSDRVGDRVRQDGGRKEDT